MTVEWTVRPEQFRSIATALHSVMMATRAEPGCTNCSLATELGKRVTVQFVEAWESEESLKRHVRSDGFVAIAGLMESATEAPRVEFALPSGTRGLDYANEVRRQTAPS
jgi:quinol monooxygenase YgiN